MSRPAILYSEQYRSHVIRLIGRDKFGPVVSISKMRRSQIDKRVVGCVSSFKHARELIDGWQDES